MTYGQERLLKKLEKDVLALKEAVEKLSKSRRTKASTNDESKSS